MMPRFSLLPLLALLAACDAQPPAPEPLTLLSVTPLTQRTDETKTVQVQLNADPVFRVDYREPAVLQVDAPVLKIGSRSVPLAYLGQGLFEGTVTPMGVGTYPVGVSLDGREATYEKSYVITAIPTTSVRFGYEFESIPPQVRGRSFVVTITATVRGQPPGEPTPSRTATLTVFTGGRDVFTSQLGPYTPGKLQQYVVINEVGDDFVALLTDSEGVRAYSNAFPVSDPPQR